MISSLIDIRSKTLAILTLFLHESFKRRKVVCATAVFLYFCTTVRSASAEQFIVII